MTAQHQQQQYSQQYSTKKALSTMILTTLLIISTSLFSRVKAFRPIIHVTNNNNGQQHQYLYSTLVSSSTTGPSPYSSSSSSSKLFYTVFGGDQDSVEQENNNYYHGNNNVGYASTNHESQDEKSCWLESLQKLEASTTIHSSSSSSSSSSDINNENCYNNDSCGLDAYGIWSRIACAFAPAPHDHLHPTMVQDAVLVQVRDTSLDIAVAVPAAPGTSYGGGGGEDQQLVQILITVDFPDGGASFCEDSSNTFTTLTAANKLSAMIQQVRLMERNANDRLLHEQVSTEVFESANDPNYYDNNSRNQNWKSH